MVKYCMNQETGVVRPEAIIDDYDGDYEDYADDVESNLPLNPRNNLLRLRQQEIRQERLQLQQQQQRGRGQERLQLQQQQLRGGRAKEPSQQRQQQDDVEQLSKPQLERQRQIQAQLERLQQLQQQLEPPRGFNAVNVKAKDLPRQMRNRNPLFTSV